MRQWYFFGPILLVLGRNFHKSLGIDMTQKCVLKIRVVFVKFKSVLIFRPVATAFFINVPMLDASFNYLREL